MEEKSTKLDVETAVNYQFYKAQNTTWTEYRMLRDVLRRRNFDGFICGDFACRPIFANRKI